MRDVEWVVRRVDNSSDGHQQLTCDGVSALVRGQEGVFLTSLDNDIEILDPARTRLVQDTSAAFARSRLFIESQLRQAVPSDDRIHVGHKAAMEYVPYQLDPARQALQQARQRILIADAVGLGKTLEAGVLVSELIARGRGRRILVLAVKSMLTQFQKEFWNRFTIPLTRLDSDGIRRVRSRIPTNHNPFHYYDKSIISIDTLKQTSEYRTYLESAYWDIIVIDEAHNVADRGTGSQRSRLAKLLSKQSDTLIMLSATPHDGKARSFASLMNILDPTAITDPNDYRKEDFSGKGLVVRRFKKDIRNQVRESFRDRIVHEISVPAGTAEEDAYRSLLNVRVAGATAVSRRDLFSVSLEKALFSSPAACLQTVNQRVERRSSWLEKNPGHASSPAVREEISTLEELKGALERIDRKQDTRYQQLVRSIRGGEPFRWSGRDTDDRLVIFTERIATLKWLREGLVKDLRLKGDQVAILHGGLIDREQQEIVEAFGNSEKKVRLLICSDVASEGINLHFRCHRMIHYDMPWSLMVFQQRNGRIDRYGQHESPEIVYLVSESSNETIGGDQRILEVLKAKDEQAYKNIGDPSIFTSKYSIEDEERLTEKAIAAGRAAEDFDRQLTPQENEGDDLLELFLGNSSGSVEHGDAMAVSGSGGALSADSSEPPPAPLSVFLDDLDYCKVGLELMREGQPSLDFDVDVGLGSLSLDAPGDLQRRFMSSFPQEVWPEDWRFELTTDAETMRRAISDSRRNERDWPRKHYLWRQNPVVEWLNDRMMAAFGRHEAPVLAGVPGLQRGEVAFAFSGLVPNRKSHPSVCVWGAVVFRGGAFEECIPLESLLERTGLDRGFVPKRNRDEDLRTLRGLLGKAVAQARAWVQQERANFEKVNEPKRRVAVQQLQALHDRQIQHALKEVAESKQWDALKESRLKRKRQDIEESFAVLRTWIRDTSTLESQPWIKLLGVMTGEG